MDRELLRELEDQTRRLEEQAQALAEEARTTRAIAKRIADTAITKEEA